MKKTSTLFGLAALFICAGSAGSPAGAQATLADYAAQPNVDRVAISPDGRHLAYILRDLESEGLFVYRIGEGPAGGVKMEQGAVQYLSFPTPEHVLLQSMVPARSGRVNPSYIMSYNLATGEILTILRKKFVRGPSLGRILGVSDSGKDVFMGSYDGDRRYEVFKVDLNTGRGELHETAGQEVIDWIIQEDGTAVAREDFDFGNSFYTIRTKRSGEWKPVYEVFTKEWPPFFLVGVSPDGQSLVTTGDVEVFGYSAAHELSFDGVASEPVFARGGAEIDHFVLDMNRTVLGVHYTGLTPRYEFYDDALNTALERAQEAFPASFVELESWTSDMQTLILQASGSRLAPAYYMMDVASGRISRIVGQFDRLQDSDIGEVREYYYNARDGLRIPAIVTLPPAVKEPRRLPLIVMPHGGPEAYNGVGFNWRAQYFASRGYMVFQPNFRGSAGFGTPFTEAGYGEWGGKMQDDITDGVATLVEAGWADPERICIVGVQYGGYAALAGGAFTPDLYRCVAAINPITDVGAFLREMRRRSGKSSFWYQYWERLIGETPDDPGRLDRISPASSAKSFAAPVLLIHGEQTEFVPFSHSSRMRNALAAAGKPVELAPLKADDNWADVAEMRVEVLERLDAFIERHIGAR